MKPKEYIKRHKLNLHDHKFNHKLFVADLTVDFMTLIETHQTKDWNYTKFQVCVKDIKSKFDAIQRSGHPQVHKKLWNFFYATVVGPAKEKMFGEQLRKEKEERERFKRDMHDHFNDPFARDMFNDRNRPRLSGMVIEEFLRMILGGGIFMQSLVPTQSFDALNLKPTATVEEIKQKYKELAFTHHPDRGGDVKVFRTITEAKNTCLNYAISQGNQQ